MITTKNREIIRLPNNIIKEIFVLNLPKSFEFILQELLENSCDANSKKIKIYLNTKKKSITVIDNGEGIDKNDLNKLCLRYYTNKIKDIDNLKNITKNGFKGESLYIVNSFSNLKIISKPKYQEVPWKIIINKNLSIKSLEPEKGKNGTYIKVTNISIKNKKYNLKKLYKIFKSISIGNPSINFILFKDKKCIFNIQKCNNFKDKLYRIKQLIKKNSLKNSIDIKYIYKDIKISGFITFSQKKKKNFLFKYIYIKNKFVKIDLLENILNLTINNLKKNFSIGYLLILDIDFNLQNIKIDSEKKKIYFKNNNLFYDVFFNFAYKYLYQYNKFLLSEKKINNKKICNNSYNFDILNQHNIENNVFKINDKILTILNNKIIIVQLDNNIFYVNLNYLRKKMITNICINDFLTFDKLKSQKLINIKHFNIKKDYCIINKKSFIEQYGFKIEVLNNYTICLIAVPTILYNYYVNWDKIINSILTYYFKNTTFHFSKNRLDMSIIKIFIDNIQINSPCFNSEIEQLYEELKNTKKNDTVWFKKNCKKIF